MRRIRTILSGVAAMLILAMAPASLRAQTWAERLDYPQGKRVVILYADHLGAAYEFNRPAQALLEEGRVDSGGLVVTGQWFDEFADWRKGNPLGDIGICLTLSSPSPIYRWRPMLCRHEIPSLVDADGFFPPGIVQVTLRADRDEVERELRAQIERARSGGVAPTHLLTHMGVLLTRPDLAQTYMQLASEYWIPAVVCEPTPQNIESMRQEGFPVSEALIAALNASPLPKLDDLQFVPEAQTYEQKRDRFYELIRSLAPGLTQIMLHPADPSPALERVSPRAEERVWEARLLQDPDVQKFLDSEGIIRTNWIEVMQRFDRRERSPLPSSADPVTLPPSQASNSGGDRP